MTVDEVCQHEILIWAGIQPGLPTKGIPDFIIANCYMCETTRAVTKDYRQVGNMWDSSNKPIYRKQYHNRCKR